MPDILHRIEIDAPPDRVYRALTTRSGLAGWWTREVEARAEVGSVARFRFGAGGPDMKVTALDPPRLVEWACVAGPPEWLGTQVSFHLSAEGERTILHFAQRGWREASDFFMHCNTRWSYFLVSLKRFAEQGRGTPHPEAMEI
jgi:uncharacterized protein YndB with AHSA1/START domain